MPTPEALKGTALGEEGWTLYMLPPNSFPGYMHPTKFGRRVVTAWWTPIRGLYDFSKWGVINVYGIGDQVKIEGSAEKGAGRIEAQIYVLYEE